jgi:hypothetical protein
MLRTRGVYACCVHAACTQRLQSLNADGRLVVWIEENGDVTKSVSVVGLPLHTYITPIVGPHPVLLLGLRRMDIDVCMEVKHKAKRENKGRLVLLHLVLLVQWYYNHCLGRERDGKR